MERITAGECRAEGRILTGVALPYGERSDAHGERFEPGAFGDLGNGRTRWLNLRHDPLAVIAHTAGGGLLLADSPGGLHIEARLAKIPAADLAIDGVNSGRLTGLSVEFHATKERREGDTRIIEKADLYGVGVVEHPSYRGARAEVRAEFRARGVRAFIPYNQTLACDCHEGPDCNAVEFSEEAFDESLEAAESGEKQILAIVGSFKHAVAGTTSASLQLRKTREGLEVNLPRLPDTAAARDLQEQASVVPIFARPVFRAKAGDFEETQRPGGTVAVYKRAELRAILLGTTDRTRGWTPAKFPEPAEGGAPGLDLGPGPGERRTERDPGLHRTQYQRTVYDRRHLWR